MNCPNCGSSEIYRQNPTQRQVYCDRCGYSWQVKQPQIPLLEKKIYVSQGSMKGQHYVSVWYCPIDSSKYSFSLNYGGGVCLFNEFLEDPYLSGSYSTPEKALQAGIAEGKNG
ncbi:MAG: hypothetical protein RMY28_006940 [Nostoc sp. ChiSLP01]|nr:hypothetical protein [Nostoc sp. CmiSLP01]MDZ8285556.1 hypothetical protein [Nostoc sp. ChiSLP01]